MGLYGQWLLPRLVDLTMRNKQALRYREKLVPRAAGRVLEIGAGSGHDLPLYGRGVSHLYVVDPSAPLMDMAREKTSRVNISHTPSTMLSAWRSDARATARWCGTSDGRRGSLA